MKNTEDRENKSTGLGDTVEKVFKATGVDKLARWALGEDCGCQERKMTLNKLFPYNKPECLTEDEYNFLDKFFATRKTRVRKTDHTELIKIHNRVFKENAKMSGCRGCLLNKIINKLNQVYNQYDG